MEKQKYCGSCGAMREDCTKIKINARGHFYLCWECRITFLKKYAKHLGKELYSTEFYETIK